jgi:hypothetical protein
MFACHQGTVIPHHTFESVHKWLRFKGGIALATAAGTHFTARAELTKRGKHIGEPVIRFFQQNAEYGRAYNCCWGHYHNCNGTRIGMYCAALDSAKGVSSPQKVASAKYQPPTSERLSSLPPLNPTDMQGKITPRLRFAEHQIETLAGRYEYHYTETELINLIPVVREKGFLEKNDLERLAYWKAPRSAGHIRKNPEDFVIEVTAFALSARTERARIETLTILDGISWPSASVILHFFHYDPYPIMDIRALWSLLKCRANTMLIFGGPMSCSAGRWLIVIELTCVS